MEILTDSETGTPDDKLRLFLIYYLLSPTVSDAEFDELSAALQGAGDGLSSLTYLRRCRQVSSVHQFLFVFFNLNCLYSSSVWSVTRAWSRATQGRVRADLSRPSPCSVLWSPSLLTLSWLESRTSWWRNTICPSPRSWTRWWSKSRGNTMKNTNISTPRYCEVKTGLRFLEQKLLSMTPSCSWWVVVTTLNIRTSRITQGTRMLPLVPVHVRYLRGGFLY